MTETAQDTKDPSWQMVTFGSGTVIVDNGRPPWVYVLSHPKGQQEDRYDIARELADLLNGDGRPLRWLLGARRVDFEIVRLASDYELHPRGPMKDNAPPSKRWVDRQDIHARDQREALVSDIMRRITRNAF